jgi:autotransporter translocation and assembly factor TamB
VRWPRRRWVKIVAGIAGLLAALVGGLLLLLATAADRALVVREALAVANGKLAGRLELQRAWLFPNGHFIAHDVAIYDPDGRLMIRAATVDTHVDLRALASGRLNLTRTAIGGAALFLATDARGDLNIARAFGAKHPELPSLPVAAAHDNLAVDIDGVEISLEEGRFDRFSPGPSVAPVAALRDARVHGHFVLDAQGAITIEAEVQRATALTPVQGPLQLTTSLSLKGPDLKVTADVTLDDAHAKSQVDLNTSTLWGRGEVTEARVGPRTSASWLPGFETRGLRGSASVELEATVVRLLALDARPLEGQGVLSGSGSLDLSSGSATAHLFAKDLDVGALSSRLPASSIRFELEGEAAQVFDGSRRVSARIDLTVPGARLRGSGALAGQQVTAHARVDAHDLDALRIALEGLGPLHLPHLAGRVSGEVALSGSLAAPALRADLRAPRLSLNGMEAEQVEAHLEAPRIGPQMDVRGSATIADFQIAGRTLHPLGVSIDWKTPHLHVEARASERGQQIELLADALLPADLESGTVSALTLRTAGEAWVLVRPSEVDFRQGIAFDHLELAAAPQRLSLSLNLAPGTLDGSVTLESLDLARVPGMPVLSGQVDGVAHYREVAGKREARAELTVTGFASQGLEVSQGRLVAALADDQITARWVGKLGHGDVTLTAAGPMPKRAGKLDLDVKATGLALDDFAHLVPSLGDYHGTIALALHVGGQWASPELLLHGSAEGLTGPWSADPAAGILASPLTVGLDVALDSGASSQSLRVQVGPTELLTLVGTAPLSSRRVWASLGTPSKLLSELLSLPFDERLTLVDLPLGPLERSIPRARRIQGTISGKGRLMGPANALKGELALTAEKLVYDRYPLGELDLLLGADDKGFKAHAELKPAQGQATATLQWQLPPTQLRSKEAREVAPLTADLQATGLPLSAALGEQSALQGLAEVSASFHGSLGRPDAHARILLHGLLLEKVPAGDLEARASLKGTRLEATLRGDQPRGGHLEGQASLPLTRDRELGAQPIAATLDAVGFELGAFSTLVTQRGSLRGIAGRLEAHLKVGGTLGSPAPNGTVALSDGKLALAGLGQFSAIEAQVGLDSAGANIRRIFGKSAAGTFLMTGTLRAVEGQGFAVQTHVDTDRFGIYASDQLIGWLSSKEDLTGTIDRTGTALTLSIARAELKLPQLVPKSAGPTSVDSDIVFGNEPPPASRNAKAYPIRVHLVAADGLQVLATDLNLKARADLKLSIQGDAEMNGGLYVTTGEVNAYGRRFEIEHANVVFGHGEDLGPANNPDIDARARETIGIYRLFIDVTGHPAHLRVVSSTEPPLNKEEVGELLITGSTSGLQSQGGTGSSQGGGLAAASAFGGFLSEKLRESLGPYMPLDVLTVEPNHLEAGKHLTRELYVGAVENLGATDPRVNGAEIHANYKLSLHWALDSRYGTARAGNFDLQWTKSW